MAADTSDFPSFTFGEDELDTIILDRLATQRVMPQMSINDDVLEIINRSAKHVTDLLENEGKIYGVTTGYGDSVVRAVPPELVAELPLHLSRFHGCGMGRFLTPEETRATLAVRLVTLVRGWSGVSMELVQLLANMLKFDILPLIPSEGSVGASGDLTPLSYIAGSLAGERDVLHNGQVKLAREAFAEEGLKEITLRPKEALAIMNGTSVMTALAGIALEQSKRLAAAATRLTSMCSLAILGNTRHYDERLFKAKPHPGQMQVARHIREDLAPMQENHEAIRMQDRYSTRCAPHVIGVLQDAMPMLETTLNAEINSSNDNPLFDPETGDVLHGGHFYGGHVCMVADTLKTQVANLADLMDRQLATLVDTRYSNGLPSNLTGATGERAPINHGFKAVQIGVSAWTAEACKLTMPASVFSRSTECHNQDKVSMGTIGARDALRVNQLTAQVAAAHMMAATQAIELRLKSGDLSELMIGPRVLEQMTKVREIVPFIAEDQPMDKMLSEMTNQILSGEMSVTF